MKDLHIQVPDYPTKYTIQIGSNILEHLTEYIDFNMYSSVMVITDSNVESLYLAKVVNALSQEVRKERIHTVTFNAGEKNKSLETIEKIYHSCATANIDRKSVVINLGGGIVSDVGGFAASTYLRGIPFINIPTTLESMVDASIGGKTGVNFESFKNYIGVFAQPAHILIDVNTLETLPERVFRQGYAEVIKHGLIADVSYFNMVRNINPVKAHEEELINIIRGSIKIKSEIVIQDVHEKGIRKLLNFGHTVGHALESISFSSNESLYHGEAVAIGMVAEAFISESIGMLHKDEFKKIEQSIKDVGLPTHYDTSHEVEEILSLISRDKKSEGGMMKWSLISNIGKGDFNIAVDQKFVRDALTYITHE